MSKMAKVNITLKVSLKDKVLVIKFERLAITSANIRKIIEH